MARTDPRPNRDLRPVSSDDARIEPRPDRHGMLAEGVPLGEIVPRALAKVAELPMLTTPRSVAAEKFRRLRTKLLHEHKDVQVIVVTSAAPDEGKSVVAANLALAFAEEGASTLLVDADLRRPTIHRWITPPPAFGLSEVLLGSVEVNHALVQAKNPPLTLLAGSKSMHEPGSLFLTDGFLGLVRSLRGRFQRIILDTPPIVPFSDADAVGGSSDAVLLVARAGQTVRSAFVQATSLLTSAPVVGVVLNDVRAGLADHQHYHDRYYDHYYQKAKES